MAAPDQPHRPPLSPAEATEAIESIRRSRSLPSPVDRGPARDARRDDIAAVTRTLENLQTRRARRQRERSITPLLQQLDREATLRRKRFGQLVELWVALLPREIAERTTFTMLRGGSLSVEADSASVAYEVNRRLRSGLLAELRRGYTGTLTRVMVSVAGRR
ncbi:MAG: DUF721 domain-containing protein [Phycisphaerales bacterium]|nr:DUF721 domain-containing protein [Phycisphaerales bacterium]